MAEWTVNTNDGLPVATVKSHSDSRITITMHTSGFLTVRKAEEIRWALGAAIGDAQAIKDSSVHDGSNRGSREGADRA